MDLAKTFRDFAVVRSQNMSKKQVLDDLKSFWSDLDREFKGGFLCVIDDSGKLTLHTGAPDREGVDVSDNIIHPSNPTTLKELVDKKTDYVGLYLSSTKKNQVAAFSYIPTLDSVVSIHVPIEEINEQINQSLLPWLTGLVLIGGIFLPLSLWFLRYMYIASQDKLVAINKDLAGEIVERKKIEQELEEHKRNLEKKVQERTHELEVSKEEVESFSYSISHDLRAPLRSIAGFSQILLEDCADTLSEVNQDYFKRICQAVSKMNLLIDDILALSRNSRTEMKFEQLDMSKIAHESYQYCLANSTGLADKIEINISEGLQAYGDKRLLEVVVQNIISNALKYSSERPTAVIDVGLHESDDDTYTYYIRDNGTGFDPQYSHKIFQPFERLHVASRYEGTGIGLATVKKIIERHAGKIWVESTVDVGTTFYIQLPRLQL